MEESTTVPVWTTTAPLASTSTAKCARGAEAGPIVTAPFASNREPWQLHTMPDGATVPVLAMSHPWCVQVRVMA